MAILCPRDVLPVIKQAKSIQPLPALLVQDPERCGSLVPVLLVAEKVITIHIPPGIIQEVGIVEIIT